MQPENKLPLLKRAFKMFVENLKEDDVVSIVVYAGSTGLVLPATKGSENARSSMCLIILMLAVLLPVEQE